MKKGVQLNIVISPELKTRIADAAWARRTTMGQLVIMAMERFLQDEDTASSSDIKPMPPKGR